MKKQKDEMLDELIDRFGEPPRSVQNLLTVAQIKADAHRVYLVEIKENAAGITFRMFERAKLNVANLPLLLDKINHCCRLFRIKRTVSVLSEAEKQSGYADGDPNRVDGLCGTVAGEK